ncbi:MAG: hypothetical protein ABFS32_16065 [Bacteroidota bacterium]
MKDLYYWKNWNPTFKIVFWVLVLLFFSQVVTILAVETIGTDNLIKWHVLTQESSYLVDIKTITKGFFDFTINAEKKVLTEVYSGGEVPTAGYTYPIMMAVIIAALLVYLSIVTLLKRFWYLVAMGGMLAFLAMLHVEMLELFGWSDTKALALVFVLLLLPSYFLHAFNQNAGFIKRLWVMAVTFLIIGGLIYFFSEAEQPYIRWFVYGSLAPYILLILFILTIAHEIISLFARAITSTSGIDNNARIKHFLILSFIYWVYILLTYLNIAHYIDWDLFYINPLVLLVISSVLSVWGSRARAGLYAGASNIEAIWPILHLLIAVVSLGMVIIFMLSVNDPLLRIIDDLIIYAHLGIGIAFILYILYNFIPLIEKGIEIRKVLYNPTNLPFLTYRLMAIMIVVALFAIKGFDYPVWYSLGGYDNLRGDYALQKGDVDLAKAYYSNGNIYAYRNHKSNYSLALLEEEKKPDEANKRYKFATDQQPKAQTYVNKAILDDRTRDAFTALFTLQNGLEELKGNSYITNNLALQFEKVKVADSAIFYLKSTVKGNRKVKNNLLALSAKYGIPLGSDSTYLLSDLDRAGKSNASALGVSSKMEMQNANHMYDMVLLNNLLLTDQFSVEDSSLIKAKEIIDNTDDQDYKDQLLFNWSLAAYEVGNIAQSLDVLKALSSNSTSLSERAKVVMGILYLDLNAYNQAEEMFASLLDDSFLLQVSVSSLESGNFENDIEYWKSRLIGGDEMEQELAQVILDVLYEDNPILDTDVKRYVYGRYMRYFIDETAENELLKKIENNTLRIDLALYLADNYYQYGNNTGTLLMLKNIEEISLNMDQYKSFLIIKALSSDDAELVQEIIVEYDSLIGFASNDYLLENTLNHKAGLSLDSLDYLHLAEDNPFFADAVLIGTSQFTEQNDPFLNYNYLAKAVQTNLSSPKLLRAYILKALDVGLDQFAENALYQYRQRFSGQSYLLLKAEYDKKKLEQNNLLDSEPAE